MAEESVKERYDSSDDEDETYKSEVAEYMRMISEGNGFDFDAERFKNLTGYGLICAMTNMTEQRRKTHTRLACHGLQKHNEERGMELEFVRIIKANCQAAAGFRYFITFEAKDVKEDHPKVYRLCIFEGIEDDDIEVEMFRLKPSSSPPSSTSSSSSGSSS